VVPAPVRVNAKQSFIGYRDALSIRWQSRSSAARTFYPQCFHH